LVVGPSVSLSLFFSDVCHFRFPDPLVRFVAFFVNRIDGFKLQWL